MTALKTIFKGLIILIAIAVIAIIGFRFVIPPRPMPAEKAVYIELSGLTPLAPSKTIDEGSEQIPPDSQPESPPGVAMGDAKSQNDPALPSPDSTDNAVAEPQISRALSPPQTDFSEQIDSQPVQTTEPTEISSSTIGEQPVNALDETPVLPAMQVEANPSMTSTAEDLPEAPRPKSLLAAITPQAKPRSQETTASTDKPSQQKSYDEIARGKILDRGSTLDNSVMQLELGAQMYEMRQYAQAKYWFERAAEGKLPEAMYNLGQMYRLGHGVESNTILAERWYREAAKLNEPFSMLNLALLLMRTPPLEGDRLTEVMALLRRASDLKEPRSAGILRELEKKIRNATPPIE